MNAMMSNIGKIVIKFDRIINRPVCALCEQPSMVMIDKSNDCKKGKKLLIEFGIKMFSPECLMMRGKPMKEKRINIVNLGIDVSRVIQKSNWFIKQECFKQVI